MDKHRSPVYFASMRMVIAFLFVLFSLGGEAAQDKYLNYADLSAYEQLGKDYQITVIDRKVATTIFAIHGGKIDWGTSIIAQSLAQNDLNLYLFEGMKPSGNIDLHITSHNFDEPQALALASNSDQCLSIHGHKGSQEEICLGGNNSELRSKLLEKLTTKTFPFKVLLFCSGLEGTAPKNIVNRCSNQGVQLEFSSALRQKLLVDQTLLAEVSKSIREAMDYLPSFERRLENLNPSKKDWVPAILKQGP